MKIINCRFTPFSPLLLKTLLLVRKIHQKELRISFSHASPQKRKGEVFFPTSLTTFTVNSLLLCTAQKICKLKMEFSTQTGTQPSWMVLKCQVE